jgi:exodeoxyribonuclease VII small subunit
LVSIRGDRVEAGSPSRRAGRLSGLARKPPAAMVRRLSWRIGMANEPAAADIAGMSFEQALEELERIVTRLEQGKVSLDEAIASYERGSALKRHCEVRLRDAREKIEKIALDAAGEPVAEPAEIS